VTIWSDRDSVTESDRIPEAKDAEVWLGTGANFAVHAEMGAVGLYRGEIPPDALKVGPQPPGEDGVELEKPGGGVTLGIAAELGGSDENGERVDAGGEEADADFSEDDQNREDQQRNEGEQKSVAKAGFGHAVTSQHLRRSCKSAPFGKGFAKTLACVCGG
jgi:hypothetical protein